MKHTTIRTVQKASPQSHSSSFDCFYDISLWKSLFFAIKIQIGRSINSSLFESVGLEILMLFSLWLKKRFQMWTQIRKPNVLSKGRLLILSFSKAQSHFFCFFSFNGWAIETELTSVPDSFTWNVSKFWISMIWSFISERKKKLLIKNYPMKNDWNVIHSAVRCPIKFATFHWRYIVAERLNFI